MERFTLAEGCVEGWMSSHQAWRIQIVTALLFDSFSFVDAIITLLPVNMSAVS